jgi:hypothetical protein
MEQAGYLLENQTCSFFSVTKGLKYHTFTHLFEDGRNLKSSVQKTFGCCAFLRSNYCKNGVDPEGKITYSTIIEKTIKK